MQISKALALDHFYISLSEEKFNKAITQLEALGGLVNKVKSNDDEWEGFYLYSRTRDYFEILKDRRPGGLGLAFSAIDPFIVNTENMINECKDFNFSKGTRFSSNGNKWFDWYSTGDYHNQNTLFNIWVMDYHHRNVEIKNTQKQKIVNSFNSLSLSLGNKYKTELLNQLKLPFFKNIEINENTILFEIFKKDGWPFKIEIQLIDDETRFNPLKLDLNYTLDNVKFNNLSIIF